MQLFHPVESQLTDLSTAPNLFDPAVLQDPFPLYRWAHEHAPVMPIAGSGMIAVMGFDVVSEATGRVDDFSNAFTKALSGARSEDADVKAVLDTGWPQVETLLTADPPVHTRFRKLVNLAFSMKRVDALEAGMRTKVDALIDGFIDRGECEFVSEFAVPLPVQVISEQLGFEAHEHAMVKRWSDAFTDRLGQMISKEREVECAHEIVEFQRRVKEKIDARRTAPMDDLLSDIVNAQVDGERPLDDAEILSVTQQLMVAGNETTSHAMAGGIVQLSNAPEQADKVRANPKLIGNLVEETLRTETPTAGIFRVATRDTELGGVAIAGGTMMMLRYAAANRDPAKFPDPDRFDVERSNARAHLAFGRGIHMCVGNMLSRKEMAVAYERLLARLDNIRVKDGATLTVAPNILLRGLTSVPITFTKR